MRTTVRAVVVAALLLAVLAVTEDATPAEAKIGPAVLSGGDLPHPIALVVEDSLALWFTPNVPANIATLPGWPSRLDTPPSAPGTGYTLHSELELWLTGGNAYALWRDVEVGDGRQPAATYYPAVSALEIRVGDDPPRWARLDDGRARLLSRYIELGRTGALPEQPAILGVLAAEARAGRPTLFTVDGRALSPADAEQFWHVAARTVWTQIPVFGSRLGAKPLTDLLANYEEAVEAMVYGYADPIWLAFDIDGRGVELAYYPMTGVVAGIPLPNGNAWIGRGFVIPPELRESFHASLGLPSIPAPDTLAALPSAEPQGDAFASASASGRITGRGGTAAMLALLALAGLTAAATLATLVREARRSSA